MLARILAVTAIVFGFSVTVSRSSNYVPRTGFVTLQFDDGHLIHHTHVAPLLEAHGFHGSFAIITESSDLGRENDLWRVGDLYQSGHEIQDHTTRHDYR